ncbi:hypothetical protein [Eubacterium pyruvativorans]|nr:hypothetical protein [Eubacterium pyruvativorans]
MREWQQTRYRDIVLPDAVFYETIWAVRDLERMEEQVKELTREINSGGLRANRMMREGARNYDQVRPTEELAVRKAALESRIRGIRDALEQVPEPYRAEVMENIVHRTKLTDHPGKVWRIWKQRFLFQAARNLCVIRPEDRPDSGRRGTMSRGCRSSFLFQEGGEEMDRGRRLFGVLLIALSVLLLISWERWGRSRFVYDDVLVLRENVQKGSVITERMLTTMRMEHAGREVLGPADRKWLIGKASSQFVHSRAPLYRPYFEKNEYITGRNLDRYTLKIPENWVESSPFSLRRGDRAIFWSGGTRITSAPVAATDEQGKTFEVVVSREQTARLGRLAETGGKFVISRSR